MEEAPNCAICNAPAYPECPCESERLQLAVKQAEHRAMEAKMADIRDWVIAHARQHVLNAFERLTSVRKQAHIAYLNSLPNYEIFMRYSGHPPIHHVFISQLNSQIAEAHAELKRGIDADWRASVLRYPEVLDYFYSLIEFRFPSDRSPSVAEPPFAVAGYADRGYSGESRSRVERKSRREGSVPPDKALRRLMRNVGPIPAPTPPLQHGPYRPPAFY